MSRQNFMASTNRYTDANMTQSDFNKGKKSDFKMIKRSNTKIFQTLVRNDIKFKIIRFEYELNKESSLRSIGVTPKAAVPSAADESDARDGSVNSPHTFLDEVFSVLCLNLGLLNKLSQIENSCVAASEVLNTL